MEQPGIADDLQPQPTGQERRQHTRYPVEGWAEILMSDGTMLVRGQISDISSAGCFIETYAGYDLPLGSLVEMIFRIKGVEFRPVAATSVVKPGRGAGFAFLKMNSKLTTQLEALIAALSDHL